MKSKRTFEEKFADFQNIVGELDSGELPLEDLLKRYEEGMKLANELRSFLEKAEQKIIDITANNTKEKSDE